MMRFAIYRTDVGMYLENTLNTWTKDKRTALTGTKGAMSAIVEDVLGKEVAHKIPYGLVECDPVSEVRSILNNAELSAEAMVSELGELFGEG